MVDIESCNVITVKASPKPLCIMNVYMPSRGSTEADAEYEETLDQIHEIVIKFNASHDIVIGGDWNASLHRTKYRWRIEPKAHRIYSGQETSVLAFCRVLLPEKHSYKATLKGKNPILLQCARDSLLRSFLGEHSQLSF